MDAGTSRCNCIVPLCRNCTNSECDICETGRLKHIDNLSAVTCDTGFGANGGCKEAYGRILGEVVTPTYTPTCIPCTLANCRFCGVDNTVCTACFTPMVLRFNGECGILPLCRSPNKLRYETELCRDCSEDYDTMEAIEAGFCSFSKAYNITTVSPTSFTQKSRRYLISSEYLPLDPVDGDLILTQEIVERTF